MNTETWNVRGKRCVVTGATSGIGEATARGLLEADAAVTLIARSETRANQTISRLKEETGRKEIDFILADFASFESIRQGAAEVLERYPAIDVLVNNAGIVNLQREETADGIEATFGVNHLGYFLFTQLLLPRLIASAPARIVNVASHAHKFSSIDFSDLQAKKKYGSMTAYGRSKGCNILFTNELARRLEGTGVTANSLHPGGVNTGLGSNNPGRLVRLLRPLAMVFMKTPASGARTSLYLATSNDVAGLSGRYFANCKETGSSQQTRDPDLASRLWGISEELCGEAAQPLSG